MNGLKPNARLYAIQDKPEECHCPVFLRIFNNRQSGNYPFISLIAQMLYSLGFTRKRGIEILNRWFPDSKKILSLPE
jgi:hypothetical protein